MTQELGTNSERALVLQQLQRCLDPFQDGKGGEKLRAYGLKSLFTRMIDPSLEDLEAHASELAHKSYEQLTRLRKDLFLAGDKPERFFAGYGIGLEDPEKLQVGIFHFDQLLDKIRDQYYPEGQLIENAVSPEIKAQAVYEGIQIKKWEQELKSDQKRIEDEGSLNRRRRLGLELKAKVLSCVGSFPFTFHRYYSDEPMEPTWENLVSRHGWYTRLTTKDGKDSGGDFGIEEPVEAAEAAITRYPLEKKLRKLPHRDKERFENLRLQYGAKAANLIMLSEMTADINSLHKGKGYFFKTRLHIPDFRPVPVGLYRAWKEERLADSELQPYFEWASGLVEDGGDQEEKRADYIVRSSAVFSEDGENVTGAGVYISVKVAAGSTFQEFKDAVARVYESTDSLYARDYRLQHGITEEDMGLVVQKYVTSDISKWDRAQEGYLNSRLAAVPELMEIVTRTSRNFIRRKELDFFLGLPIDEDKDSFRKLNYFPPDQFKVWKELPGRMAQLASVIERIWERDIQLEFVADIFDINIVQVRELPIGMLSSVPEVKFPDELPVHVGLAVGRGDIELKVLKDDHDEEEKGVVIIPTNDMFTVRYSDNFLPKEGAVIISYAGGRNGHIQTLCAERGIICIFPDTENEDMPALSYSELLRMGRMRIVANGLEGRVYPVDNYAGKLR